VAKVAATETSNSSYLLPKNSMILRNNAWVSKKGTSRVCTSDHHLLLLPPPLLFRVHKPALDTIPNFFGLSRRQSKGSCTHHDKVGGHYETTIS
jgi:hypothetical protein